MLKGKTVMVKTTFNQPVIRILLSENNGVATICRGEVYSQWQKGGSAPRGATVSKADVFEFDADLYEEMKKWDEELDNQPKELLNLWVKAVPVYTLTAKQR